MTIWVIPYLGVPHNLWVDQAKAFMSVQFKTLASSLGCNIIPIAVEAHWSLIAERYHDPLRRIVHKLVVDHPAAPLPLIVDFANLAMSHTIGPEGYTPAVLAFGAQPRLPIGQYEQQPQSVVNRMDLMSTDRREYESIVAQLRIRKALNSASPNETVVDLTPGDEVVVYETVVDLTPGDEVLVYREDRGWEGPFTFLFRDGRLAVTLDDKGREHTFHSNMIKPYQRPNIPIQDLLNPADTPNDEPQTQDLQAHLVESVHDQTDPRFAQCKQAEYNGILEKGGVKSVHISSLPPHANFVGNRYVLCIKDPGTPTERFKARWIIQGHQDRFQHTIANNSPMLMRLTLRIIVSFSATFFGGVLWTRDVEQAYMQSPPLQRDVFTRPPPEAKLPPDHVLKIQLPHYGLVESSSCFFDAYYPVFATKLGMRSAPFDPCFLYRTDNATLTGIVGLATDDSLNTGTPQYRTQEQKATSSFATRSTTVFPLRFLGFLIQHSNGMITLSQDQHIDRLNTVNTTEDNANAFVKIRGQLLFISQSSRPDISYVVSQLCQVHKQKITKEHRKLLNDTVLHVKNTKEWSLKYRKLHVPSLKLYVFRDSGYNTNTDATSQLETVVCLVDKDNHCHILHWLSSKCPRITRSMLAGETYAFSHGYDYGVSLRMLFHQMHVRLPLFLFTDSKSIFDTITASKRLRELRLMNEISDIRRAYKDGEITNVGWIRSEQNIADNLTRGQGNNILNQTMATGKLSFIIEQWVYNETTHQSMQPSTQIEEEENIPV